VPTPAAVFVFGQAGCPACLGYIPRFKRIAAPYRGRIQIGVYDLARDGQHANEFASKLGIRATPTTVVMNRRGGLHKHVGALGDAQIKQLLDSVAG
jgi:thioredoxin-like negative regulator of GroEL